MKQETDSRHTARVPRLSLPTWDARRFRAAREAKGWTIAQLAAAAGLNTSTVQSYGRGAVTPSPAALVTLAEALGVATTDLAPLSNPPRLHELRWHRGLAVSDVAHHVGLSRTYTSAILRGETGIVDPDRWAAVLGVDGATVQRAWQATRTDLNPRR